MESKIGNLNFYDEMVSTVVANVLTEQSRVKDKQIYIKWFEPSRFVSQKIYFYGACIVADVTQSKVYLDMPLHEYLWFKLTHWKYRTQIKRIKRDNVPLEVVRTQLIIDHIEEYFKIRSEANEIWNDILTTYYEPKKGEIK